MKFMFRFVVPAVALALAACSPGTGPTPPTGDKRMAHPAGNLSDYSDAPPAQPVPVLFIHHSCGGQLLAETGPETGDHCIHPTHPNGGGLRRLLEENRYVVHEASYGSVVGEKTDICDWRAKFQERMPQILACRRQDDLLDGNTRNRVVIFKSCFPNNWIEAEGEPPGDPDSPRRTLANCQAAYRALLDVFRKEPGTLFIAMTAPPLAEPAGGLRDSLKILLGREDSVGRVGDRARRFNAWLADPGSGWLAGYELPNVAVFDLYGVLTGHGSSPWSAYPTGNGADSHPSAAGNALAAREFVPMLNRAVRRMGI